MLVLQKRNKELDAQVKSLSNENQEKDNINRIEIQSLNQKINDLIKEDKRKENRICELEGIHINALISKK